MRRLNAKRQLTANKAIRPVILQSREETGDIMPADFDPEMGQEQTKASPPDRYRGHNRRRSPFFLALLAIVFFLLFFSEIFGTSCYVSSMIGIPCPGCGSTRALLLLLQGDVIDALRMHPLIFVTLSLFAVIPGFSFLQFFMRKRGRELRLPLSPGAVNVIFVLLAAAYLVLYAIRMILYFPHTEPMLFNEYSLLGRLVAIVKKLGG
jgi:hypothetical protein